MAGPPGVLLRIGKPRLNYRSWGVPPAQGLRHDRASFITDPEVFPWLSAAI